MFFTKLTKRFPIEDKKTATSHLLSQEAWYINKTKSEFNYIQQICTVKRLYLIHEK